MLKQIRASTLINNITNKMRETSQSIPSTAVSNSMIHSIAATSQNMSTHGYRSHSIVNAAITKESENETNDLENTPFVPYPSEFKVPLKKNGIQQSNKEFVT